MKEIQGSDTSAPAQLLASFISTFQSLFTERHDITLVRKCKNELVYFFLLLSMNAKYIVTPLRPNRSKMTVATQHVCLKALLPIETRTAFAFDVKPLVSSTFT